jgi:hypothetical protein
MSISEPDLSAPPKKKSLLKSILKQALLALCVGAVVLALYLMISSSETEDKSIGKYAYISKNGEFIGKIRGQGRSRKGGNQVYFIEEPTGAVIEMAVSYVEVREKPPKYD